MNQTPPPGQKMGRSMLTITWILVLIGLTFVFGVWEEKKYNPNTNLVGETSSESRSVTLKQNAYNHYVAEGQINGKPVIFILDTGATDVAVPAKLARTLNLTPGAKAYAYTANGTVETRRTIINNLSLGPITLQNVRASINPGMTSDEILLGMSALADLDLNQSQGQLTITQYTY